MIQQIQRIRPNFGQIDLLLHQREGEISFLPSELVPNTTIVSLQNSYTCEIEFEYQINEDATTQTVDIGIKLVTGKYTNKVLKITIDFNSFSDLLNKIIIAANRLENRRKMLTKDSHKKNYDLVGGILGDIIEQLGRDNRLKQFIGG